MHKMKLKPLYFFLLLIDRLAMERDSVERESREKETKILSLSRELEDLRDRVEEAERLRLQQARELEDIMSSKDDVGKNVSDLHTYWFKVVFFFKNPSFPFTFHFISLRIFDTGS